MTRITETAETLTADESATKRRHRSKQERRQIVEESLQPGASVALIARSHGVNANQVFQWRKLYRQGLLDQRPATTQLMPVHIAEVVHEEQGPTGHYSGTIHIELGPTRVRIEGSADPDSLRLVLGHLSR
jgi:transposase